MERKYLVTAVRDITCADCYGRTDVLGAFDTEEEAWALFNLLEVSGRTREVCITVGGWKVASKRRKRDVYSADTSNSEIGSHLR